MEINDDGRTTGRRRRGALILLGVGLFGLAVASAASLGGLNTTSLGADNGAVASCDTDGVALAYTTAYSATDGRYKVTSVTVSGIATPACDGKTLRVTLSDAAFVSLGTGSATVLAGGSQAVAITPNADAELAVNAAVVIAD